MADWRQLTSDGKYDEAEADMLAETDLGEGLFPINEVRAGFYENWGDALDGVDEKASKYKAALHNWEMWASCATSGGEGTARMIEVARVSEKLEWLYAN